MPKGVLLVLVMLCSANPDYAMSQEQRRCELTGSDWNWFSDHVTTSATYVVQANDQRRLEIGTGLSLFGRPRGSVVHATGKTEITAWGIGALHVRVSDGGPPTLVCVAPGSLGTITFVDIEF